MHTFVSEINTCTLSEASVGQDANRNSVVLFVHTSPGHSHVSAMERRDVKEGYILFDIF